MDAYSLKPEKKVKKKTSIWNLLTLLALLGICGVVALVYAIFTNPQSFLNPFKPQVLPTAVMTATPTITNTPEPPTITPTETIQITRTRTKAPTWTPLSSDTPKSTKAASTLTITGTPMPATADITYAASTTVHADLGCKWMGVGGKVLDADGKALPFQTLQLSGTLGGKPVKQILVSGHDPLPAYGPAGFEFFLGTAPVDSTQELWIQLFDNKGIPLTNKIYFDTFTDCKKNLVMVTFTKTK